MTPPTTAGDSHFSKIIGTQLPRLPLMGIIKSVITDRGANKYSQIILQDYKTLWINENVKRLKQVPNI